MIAREAYCRLLLVFSAMLLSCLPAFWFFIVPPLPRALDAGFLLSAELSPLNLPLPIAVSSARSPAWAGPAALGPGKPQGAGVGSRRRGTPSPADACHHGPARGGAAM